MKHSSFAKKFCGKRAGLKYGKAALEKSPYMNKEEEVKQKSINTGRDVSKLPEGKGTSSSNAYNLKKFCAANPDHPKCQ